MMDLDRSIGLGDYTEIEEPEPFDWDELDEILDELEDRAYIRAAERRLFKDD